MPKWIFNAKIDNIEKCNQIIEEQCGNLNFLPKEINQVQLAMEEAVVNIIKHAYGNDESQEFSMEMNRTDNDNKSGILLRFTDTGPFFNPLEKKDPDTHLALEEREIGGLGILMIKQMMDELDYQRLDEQNVFSMIKYKQ